MAGRTGVLALTLGLLALMVFLTIRVAIQDGFTIIVAVALGIIGVIAFGVLGALGSERDE